MLAHRMWDRSVDRVGKDRQRELVLLVRGHPDLPCPGPRSSFHPSCPYL